jgi:uncharacterized repeat protein (TIGR01451 family)
MRLLPPTTRPLARLAHVVLLSTFALISTLSFARADIRPPAAFLQPTPPPVEGKRPIDDPALAGKIDPALRKRLLAAQSDERIPIVIEMRQQADLDPLLSSATEAQSGEVIVGALQATAFQSQADLRIFLAAELSAGRAAEIRSFWIFNGLAAHVVPDDIAALAARNDVGLIREDRYRQWIDSNDGSPATASTWPLADRLAVPLPGSLQSAPVEWGIAKIRADEVWAALNISGTGVVVANMDTGVDWQHPALQTAYRGYFKGLGNHAGNWFDATDAHASYAVDPHGHGTHTMGTIVGAGGIGVAPGAKWIAVRVLSANGFGYDSWIHAGFQWILAPNGDPALAPDVLNNSWGKDVPNDTVFQNDLRALRQAGIFAVFSNGNTGPDASSVGSPAALPEAFAVGATDDEDAVAAFSSRGPAPSGEIRPHVAAPGVNVRSAVPGGYSTSSGTSMAAPHVAGTIALMLSSAPSLTITDTVYALTRTAVPLTTTLPNNASGYGRIDAYAAVQSVAGLGAISGTVTRSSAGNPVIGATVTAVSSNGISGGMVTTGADGRYTRGLASSIYTVTTSAFGYVNATQTRVMVFPGTTTPLNFALAPLPTGTLRGALSDAASGQAISGTIFIANTPVTMTANHTYSLSLPAGSYEVRVVAPAHRVLTAPVTIATGQTVVRDFALPPAPTILLVDSGAWYNNSQIGYYRNALDDLSYTYDNYRVKNLPIDAPISTTLAPYDIVVWSAPYDSPGLIGSGNAISSYLSAGGHLFLSGQDVGYWDGGLSGSTWAEYYYAYLKANVVADNAGSHTLSGTNIFTGVNVTIEGALGADDQEFPDAIISTDPAATAEAFQYDNGLLGGQSVGLCLPYRAVYLGFGFEAINSASARREVLTRTLAYFGSPRNTAGMTLGAVDNVVITQAGGTAIESIRLRNLAELGISDTFTLAAQSSGWNVSLSNPVITLGSCSTGVISAAVSIPPGTPTNASQIVTLTARSTLSPALVVSDTFVVKTPAAALIVDDDRWYDMEGAYQTALISNGISFDRWDVAKTWMSTEPAVPSPDRMNWYPFVIWFTGYDWYQPLTAGNETTLTQYLDAGGRVLISAQDYLSVRGLNSFGRARLGILDYAEDMTTTVARGPSLPGAADSPFDGLGPVTLVYTYTNYSDALAPYPTATVALVGSHGRPIALTHKNGTGKAMFFAFPFETIAAASRTIVMDRIVGYLSWLGSSSVTANKTVAAPGDNLILDVVIRNDGPRALASAGFTTTLPAGVSLQSGSTTWTGSLSAGASVTASLAVRLSGGLTSGSLITIPVTFRDGEHAITFHKEARVGISRPDLSTSMLATSADRVRSSGVVTLTIVARNSGLVGAPSAIVTGLLPFKAMMVSGTLTASTGSASELSGTITWKGSIPANGLITVTYQMSVPNTVTDQSYFGSALFDDGATVSQAARWLMVQPYRAYLPRIYKSSP